MSVRSYGLFEVSSCTAHLLQQLSAGILWENLTENYSLKDL